MRPEIVSVTNERIIIDGIIPIDKESPVNKRGKVLSPDPLIRICHKNKKELISTHGACVSYTVLRPTTNGDSNKTIIQFYYSNTGLQELPSNRSKDIERISSLWLGEMSQRCAEDIEKYLGDTYGYR